MIRQLGGLVAGIAAWTVTTQHRRDRRAQIDFYATKLWSTPDPQADGAGTPSPST